LLGSELPIAARIPRTPLQYITAGTPFDTLLTDLSDTLKTHLSVGSSVSSSSHKVIGRHDSRLYPLALRWRSWAFYDHSDGLMPASHSLPLLPHRSSLHTPFFFLNGYPGIGSGFVGLSSFRFLACASTGPGCHGEARGYNLESCRPITLRWFDGTKRMHLHFLASEDDQ